MSETLEIFYENLLGVKDPWKIVSVKRDTTKREVTAQVSLKEGSLITCPVCQKEGKVHDKKVRTWRHLDSCNHTTIVEAAIPRVKCLEHGVKQMPVSWAEKGSHFTAEFERAVLVWLQADSIKTVAYNFGISWDEVDGIMSRAVKRGLECRVKTSPKHIGIDETSFQKRHQYVTVILDKDTDTVIDILDDRKAETLDKWFKTQDKCDLSKVESITMDMWDAFIKAVKDNFSNAVKLIAFDRFHVSQHFGKAVSKVRAEENNPLLIRTKFNWLINSNRTDNRATKRKDFLKLTRLNLKTARAWHIKETASLLWNYTYMGTAEKNWKELLGWISRCRLKPIIKVGTMIRKYFYGILNAIRLKANNSMLEAKNAVIQKIKKTACGFRNKVRFKNAILFQLGGLDILPFPHYSL